MKCLTIISLIAICICGGVLGRVVNDDVIVQLNRPRRQAWRWKNGVMGSRTISYYFQSNLNYEIQYLFMGAIRAWEKDTCVKFVNNKTASSMQVGAFSRGGCYHQGNGKTSWLNAGCGHLAGITHEVGHAIGLGHTHNRHDRDKYLNMDWGNVERGFYDISRANPLMTLQVNRDCY
ncbi:hypothetical protein Y032_0010g877 [Ancylostoma ceylanicum]|uniref:Metalloendopeptidase n=1 Tax=Ancylostoma ceylanicum TaxID=53326 RepID=A0A016VGV3_9BILA|nr:hypothetical protein Y032_0010g877 [Ancylostoma ceylanicum]